MTEIWVNLKEAIGEVNNTVKLFDLILHFRRFTFQGLKLLDWWTLVDTEKSNELLNPHLLCSSNFISMSKQKTSISKSLKRCHLCELISCSWHAKTCLQCWTTHPYPLSGETESAGWRRRLQFQIQRPWYDPDLLQSNQYSYWSNGVLESDPGVRSFLWLPGLRYWGSLRCRARQRSQGWSSDSQLISQLWSEVVAQQGNQKNCQPFPRRESQPLLSPTVSRRLWFSLRATAALLHKSKALRTYDFIWFVMNK